MQPKITIHIPPGQPQCPACRWFNGKHQDDCEEFALEMKRRRGKR